MAENSEKLLDDVGWQLLGLLQEDARLSFKELGQRVGLAPSSVAERIHRMEEAEILLGYHAEINLEKIGLPVVAFIRMNTAGQDRKSTRLNSSHDQISYAVFCLKKK